jgi:hypothetical protein
MSRAINTITAATAVDGATNLNIDSGTLFVDTTNNFVGVGTTSPIRKLSLEGGGIGFQDAGGSASRGITWNDSTTSNSPLQILGNYTTGNCFLIFATNTFGSAAVERLRIDSSGNVGVGTTSPSDILHVSKANGVSIFESPGVSSVGLRLRTNTTDRWQIGCPSASADLAIYTGAAATERLRINANGSLLIGTTSETTGVVKLKLSDGTIDSVYGYKTAGVEYAGTLTNHPYAILTNNAERLRIDPSGNFLMMGASGSTSPAGDAVNGIALKTPASAANGMVEICNANLPALILGSTTGDAVLARFRRAGTVVGSISVSSGATAFTTTSDYRLKTNLEPLSNGINRIKQLPVYRFNWIADEGGNKVDGFIAHEAKSIVPECVIGEKDAIEENGNPAYQGIDQSKIVPLLTAALKEAIAKIETLEAKVTALEAA